jgi:hypothetical protein
MCILRHTSCNTTEQCGRDKFGVLLEVWDCGNGSEARYSCGC